MTDTDRLAALLHEAHVGCIDNYHRHRCDPTGDDLNSWHDDDAARLRASGVLVDDSALRFPHVANCAMWTDDPPHCTCASRVTPVPLGVDAHQQDDPHEYRITCTVCGERGTLRVSVDPQNSAVAAERVPCPHCPHWMSHHNPDGSCGCGATHPEPERP